MTSTDLSKPLEELPGFLSTISMVEDDRSQVIKGFVAAERKSPPRYDASRQLILRVLEGQLPYADAVKLADTVTDPIDRRCARQVMLASRPFLEVATPSAVATLPTMEFEVRPGLKLTVNSVRLRQLPDPRLLILHLWDKPLSERQVRAALAITRRTLLAEHPQHSYRDIDFVSVATPQLAASRRCQVFGWETLPPMDDLELDRLLRDLLSAWDEYQRQGPRPVKRRGPPTLFD